MTEQNDMPMFDHSIHRLPSVETMLVRWFRLSRHQQGASPGCNLWLRRGGYRIYVRWQPWPSAGFPEEFNLITIASIEAPARTRGRGWFWEILSLCLLMSGRPVIVECVHNKQLSSALERKGARHVTKLDFIVERID
jgi:hypothetical protein